MLLVPAINIFLANLLIFTMSKDSGLGKPCHTWLRAVEADLGQLNIGLASAWRKAAIREDWRRIVDTANAPAEYALKQEEENIKIQS